MKPLRNRIQAASRRFGISQQVIEKDYILSYILAGISYQPDIKDVLIFKGGTALKKVYFGDYRFSEDLDFSAIKVKRGAQLAKSVQNSVSEALRLLTEHGPFDVEVERYLERDPHPFEQEAFVIRTKFPWHPRPLCRIKIEITNDEPVLIKPVKRSIIHDYDEKLHCRIACYQLEEIVVEKLRTLLQTHKKLIERGWNRPRVRDYYDLWQILRYYFRKLNANQIFAILDRKFNHRNVTYRNINDFFSNELVTEAQKSWNSNLSPFISKLPDCDYVLYELRKSLGYLFKRHDC